MRVPPPGCKQIQRSTEWDSEGWEAEALTWRLCIEIKGNKGNNVKRI